MSFWTKPNARAKALTTNLWNMKNLRVLLIGGYAAMLAYCTHLLSQNLTGNSQVAKAEATNNLQVSTASYLGGPEDDRGTAIEIASDKTIVLSGKIIGNDFGKTPVNLLGGGSGIILRTNSTEKNILSLTRIGVIVDDLAINSKNGKIAVVGDFGIALLDPKAKNILWHKEVVKKGGATTSNGRRIAVGRDGKVVALLKKNVTVFAENGREIGEFRVPGKYVEDVTIHSQSNSVLVTGYSQKNKGGCKQLQVAFIRSYDYAGNLNWTNYDWTHPQAYAGNRSCADSRGDLLTIGRDGKLYFAGESAGGNSIYRYDPKDLSVAAPNVKFDPYNHAYNTASNHITYYARFNPVTGDIETGQFLLSRLNNGKGNTIKPRSITADEQGNVYIGGSSAAKFAGRDRSQISGQTGAYADADNFVLAVPPNFNSRTFMVTWNQGCKGKNRGYCRSLWSASHDF